MAQLQPLKRKNQPMISPVTGSNPNKRTARFLNPSVTSPVDAFFAKRRCLASLKPHVFFHGWRDPLAKWAEWVDRMEFLHGTTWREAGIHGAVLSSKYAIKKGDIDIVWALAERWWPHRNSFMTLLSEERMSLDDVAELGGYSLTGGSAVSLDTDDEVARKDGLLMKGRDEMNASSFKKVGQSQWLRKFMGSEHEVEHEAFLVLWLSRHVFPQVKDVVGKHLHKLAIALARGTRVALAPLVLTSLRYDLKRLNRKIMEASVENEKVEPLDLWSPMQLVLVWAWEKFPSLRPVPNRTEEGEPRLASWDKVAGKGSCVKDINSALDNAHGKFVWRSFVVSEHSRT